MSIERDIDKLAERSHTRREELAIAVYRNRDTWEELLREDEELTRIEIGIAWCARIEQTEPPGSPQHAAARAEDWRLRERRYALWTARAARSKALVPV